MFDGRKIKPKCKICVPCEHKGFTKHIDIMIVKQDVPSVLGLNACISLNLIKRIDNLQNCNKVEDAFSDIFDDLGVIDNFVHKIQLKTDVKPIINPPRRVPVALRELLKAELNRLEDLNVIEKITEPTEWVNSLVIVKKKYNALRICLDPLHLNRAIKREHFPMQTIEDIMTRMSNAKYFSVLDANHGFWQIKQLLEKDIEWFWGPEQNSAFEKLKYAISNAPVLKYFNVNEPVILSVDASSKRVGACLIQNGRPVAYASKSLTKCQQNFAQIEKEMYAIVFGCERFHDYLFGQVHITVQSDHKPLETILKKPLHCAPMRLQRMILRIQSYPLDVKYKAGKELYIADALSRAYDSSEYSSEKEEELYDVNLLEYEDMKE
uniref:uncharacterized protein LOC120332995 n=1 Tax=Styela clava TaxID=7725 RepID=UPI001939C82D|nr:uncharacterized protein LOC120332995 [Styela clava]